MWNIIKDEGSRKIATPTQFVDFFEIIKSNIFSWSTTNGYLLLQSLLLNQLSACVVLI